VVDLGAGPVDAGGAERFALLTTRDVTERRERERELARYETLVQEVTDVVTVIGETGVVEYQSPAAEHVLGYEPAELVGESAFEHVHPEDREAVSERFAELVERPGATEGVEFRMRTADGDWRWIESKATNRTETAFEGYVVTPRDVTERVRREERLSALHEATRAFMEAPDRESVADRAVETARSVLDMPVNGLWFYEPDTDALEPAAVTDEAVDLLSYVDHANENASFLILEGDTSLDGSGELSDSYNFQSGQWVIFAAVKEDGANGFTTTNSDISVDGDVTIIGTDMLAVQDGSTTVTDEPETADPGETLNFDIDASDAFDSGDSVTHAVVVYRASTMRQARFDAVVDSSEFGNDFDASEDAQLEHSIDEVNGVADVEDGTTINGNDLSDGTVQRPVSLGAIVDFIAEDAGGADPNTHPITNGGASNSEFESIDASVTAVNGESPTTTVAVDTFSNYSNSATYRYVVVSTLDDDETQLSTATGTLTLSGSSGGGGGGGGGGGDDGGDDDDTTGQPGDTPAPVQQTVTFENGSSTTTISAVTPGQTISVNIDRTAAAEDGAVSQVNFTSTEDASDVQVRIRDGDAPTGGVPANDRSPTIFRYTQVTLDNLPNADETPGTFRFTVSEDRLERLDVEPENVQMYRYNDGSWNTIETTHVGGDQYFAETPGYSWFSVGVEQSAQETDEPVDDATDAEEQVTATEAPDDSGGGGGLPLIVIGIVVALVAVVAGVLYLRSN
jgi:PAS domain S-box-containing protein/PGF-pre-PGF domain-containing protein